MAEVKDTYIIEFGSGDDGLLTAIAQLRIRFDALNKAVLENTKLRKEGTEAAAESKVAIKEETVAIKEVAGATEDAAVKTKSLSDQISTGLKTGLGLVTAALATATAGAVAFAATTVALSAAGTEQQKVDQLLIDSLASRGASAEEARKNFDRLNATIGQAVTGFGATFGDEALIKGMATYVRMTGNMQAGTAELDRIMKIAVVTGGSFEEASKQAAEAHKGQGEALSKLTALNAQQVGLINATIDPTARAAKANEALDKALAGVDVRTQTAAGSLARWGNVSGDMRQELGKVINQSGLMQAIMEPLAARGEQMVAWVSANSAELQRLALTIGEWVVTGLQTLATMMLDTIMTLGWARSGFQVMGLAWQEVSTEMVKNAASMSTEMVVGLTIVIDKLMEMARTGIEAARTIATALGADGLVESVNQAEAALEEMGKSAKGSVAEINASVLEYQRKSAESFEKNKKAYVEDAEALKQWGKKSAAIIDETANQQRDALRNARANVRADLGPRSQVGAGAAPAAAPTDPNIAINTELLRIERQLIEAKEAGDILEAGRLEAEKIRLEGARTMLTLKGRELRREQKLLTAAKERQAILAAEQEQVKAWAAEAEQRHNNTLKRLGDEAKARANLQKKEQEARKKAAAEQQAAYQAQTKAQQQAAAAATGIAEIVIRDQRKRAVVDGTIQTALSIGQFASWAASGFTNAAAAVAGSQHALSAAKFFAVAGTSGGGAGGAPAAGGGAGGGGGASGGGGTSGADIKKQQGDNAKAIADAIVDANRAREERTVTINMYSPTLLGDAPETQRLLADTLRPELERTLNNGRPL